MIPNAAHLFVHTITQYSTEMVLPSGKIDVNTFDGLIYVNLEHCKKNAIQRIRQASIVAMYVIGYDMY